MRAVILKRFGGPEAVELGEWPTPEPKAGELEIDVHYAGLNPVDLKIRNKKMWPLLRLSPPLVMGNECSGVVRRLGAGVTRFAPGDRVFTRTDKHALGAFAPVCCVREDVAGHVPAGVSLKEAGAVALVGLTALQALFETGALKSGQTVFVQAGAGGFGTIAIQLAKRAGAKVATTASGAGLELVKRLGADQAIDYKQKRWQDELRDVDIVIDTLGGQQALDAAAVLRPGGIVISIGGDPTIETARENHVPLIWHPAFWWLGRQPRAAAARHQGRYAFLFLRPDGKQLEDLAQRIARKELEVVIDKVFPFEQAKEALAYVESGRAKGKVVLEMKAEATAPPSP